MGGGSGSGEEPRRRSWEPRVESNVRFSVMDNHSSRTLTGH